MSQTITIYLNHYTGVIDYSMRCFVTKSIILALNTHIRNIIAH